MPLRLLISLSLLLAWQAARAQTADDFFDSGAQFYISNNIPAALEKTEGGLKLYPDNVKLQKLEKLLKQQQQSQSQQNQQKNQQNQQSQSQQQQQKNQQSQQNEQKNQQSQNQKNQKQQQPQEAQKQSGQNGNEKPPAQAAQGDEMTPEEAKQLLDAQKGDEQVLQFKPDGKPPNENQPIKDW